MLFALLAGAIAFQSFACSSKNLTTAKLAYKTKEYDKALEYLKNEIALNPANAEAYALQADIYLDKAMYAESADAAIKAYENAKEEELKKREQAVIQEIWIKVYNEGINIYNNYLSSPEKRFLLDSSLYMFNTGQKVRPKLGDFYRFKGMVLEAKGDSAAALQAYKEYIITLKPQIDFARSKNIYYAMPRRKSIQQLGTPTKSISTINEAMDTSWADIYNIDGKEIYTFSSPSDAGTILKYWKVEFSKDIPANEKLMPYNFSFEPFSILAQYYYGIKQLDSAFKYIQLITYLDPNNNEANRSLLSLYQEMGKTDVALKQAAALTKSDPGNKFYWAQYGDLLQNLKNYDEAIKAYEKALELDASYDFVLRNIGSAYKNKSSIIQREQQDKETADNNYKPITSDYFPLLIKSSEYFAKAMQTEKFQKDFRILGEMANIYTVINDDTNLKKALTSLENLESTIVDKNDKESYYLILINVYGTLKQSNKLIEIQTKLKNL
jgi:tetratricopeptide (TPR) repeat protein